MTSTNDRWVVAVHEAGHGVAGVELGGRCVGLALREDGGLASVHDLNGSKFAFMVAAGPAAEYLATEHPAPELPAVDDDHAGEQSDRVADDWDSLRLGLHVARVGSHPQEYPSDDRTIALWAVTGREDDPDSWARRVAFAKHVASEIIEKNVGTVMRVATELFIKGRLSRDEVSSYLNTRD